MRTIKLFLMFLLIIILVGTVRATSLPQYSINTVWINGIAAGNSAIYIEKDSTLSVVAQIKGCDSTVGTCSGATRVRLKAWIVGAEDDIEATSESFRVEPDTTQNRHVFLEIPKNIETSQTYKLHVKVYDADNEIEKVYTLRATAKDHELSIEDVLFTPSLQVDSGKNINARIRIENIGYSNEEDVKVYMKLNELGLETHDFLDKVYSNDSSEKIDLSLTIPENAKAGTYTLIVGAEYGDETTEQTYDLVVNAPEQVIKDQYQKKQAITIKMDTMQKDVQQGKGIVYKVLFANLDGKEETFSIDIDSLDFGSFKIDPDMVTIEPDSTGEAYIYISTRANTKTGLHSFTVNVKNENVNKQFDVVMNVIPAGNSLTGNAINFNVGNIDWKDSTKGLEVGFAALIVIIVILAIILVITRAFSSGSEEHRREDYY